MAKEVELKDPYENMGAQLVREVASKTSDVAGDGTTTATVLAQAIYREGMKNVTAGANPMDIKRGIDKAVEAVIANLKKMTQADRDKKEIAQVGTISANNDSTIGDLIAEADGQSRQGRRDHGRRSQVHDHHPGRRRRHAVRPRLHLPLLRDQCREDGSGPRRPATSSCPRRRSRSMKDLLPILEQIAKMGKPLVIIAEDVEGEALATLVVNKLRGTLQICAIKAPGLRRPPQGNARRHRDPDRRPGDLRRPRHQAREREDHGPRPRQEDHHRQGQYDDRRRLRARPTTIQGRVKQIKAQIDETTSDYDREKLQERLAKIVGGVAVINVGAATETEMKEKKARVEDALHATTRGHGRRHRRRRRRGAASLHPGAREAEARGRRADRRRTSCGRRSKSRCARS